MSYVPTNRIEKENMRTKLEKTKMKMFNKLFNILEMAVGHKVAGYKVTYGRIYGHFSNEWVRMIKRQ